MSNISVKNVLWGQGQNNDGGIKTEIYFIPIEWIKGWPQRPANPTQMEDLVTLAGNFVLETGRYWTKIYCTLQKGMLKSGIVGERDGKSAENDIELWHPGNKAYLLGFIEYFKNTPMVLLVKELDETYVRVIGSDGLPAALENGEITTGNAVKDSKGAKLSFKSIGRIAPIYAGLIQMKTSLLLALDFAGGGIGYVGYGNNTFTIGLTSLTPDPTFFVWDSSNPVHKLTLIGDLPTGTTAVIENGKIKVTGVLSAEGLFVFRLLGQTTNDGTPTGTVVESYGFDMTIDVLA